MLSGRARTPSNRFDSKACFPSTKCSTLLVEYCILYPVLEWVKHSESQTQHKTHRKPEINHLMYYTYTSRELCFITPSNILLGGVQGLSKQTWYNEHGSPPVWAGPCCMGSTYRCLTASASVCISFMDPEATYKYSLSFANFNGKKMRANMDQISPEVTKERNQITS